MPETRQLIAQRGHFSGDLVAIATMLMHDPTSHLLISRCGADPRDVSAAIQAFYRSCGLPDDRVHFWETGDLDDQASLNRAAQDLAGPQGQLGDLHLTPVSPQAAIDFLLAQWGKKAAAGSRTLPQQIRLRWGFNPDAAVLREELSGLQQRLQERGLTLSGIAGQKVAVIWSPFHNQENRSDPKNDSPTDSGVSVSHEAWAHVMQDIAAACLGSDIDLLILAGDRDASVSPAAPLDMDIDTACPVIDLTGLWSADEDRLLDHVALYDYLALHCTALTHLGLHRRTLEALTLLGHHVGGLILKPGPEHGTDDHARSMATAAATETWAGLSVAGLHYTPLILDAGSRPGSDSAATSGFIDPDRTALAACLRASHAHQNIRQEQAQQKTLTRADRAAYLVSLRALAQSQTALKAALQSQQSVLDTRQQRLERELGLAAPTSAPAPAWDPILHAATQRPPAADGESPMASPDTRRPSDSPALRTAAPVTSRLWIAQHLAYQKKRIAAQIEKVTHSLANTQQALSLLDDPDLVSPPEPKPAAASPGSSDPTGSLKLPTPARN